MTEDHHHYKQRLETVVANIQNSDKIREENKELVVDFGNWLALRSISYGRQYRYISSLKQILEHNDFRLDNLEEDDESKRKIHTLLGQVEKSEYYSKEYSMKTKMEYKSAIKRLLEFQELTSNPGESPLLPKDLRPMYRKRIRNGLIRRTCRLPVMYLS